MGVLISEQHGENQIVQMSKILHDLFLKRKEVDIVSVRFNIEEIDESFIHYFTSDEDISQFKNGMSLDEFENEFSKISGDPGSSIHSFKDYLKETQSKVIEKECKILENSNS